MERIDENLPGEKLENENSLLLEEIARRKIENEYSDFTTIDKTLEPDPEVSEFDDMIPSGDDYIKSESVYSELNNVDSEEFLEGEEEFELIVKSAQKKTEDIAQSGADDLIAQLESIEQYDMNKQIEIVDDTKCNDLATLDDVKPLNKFDEKKDELFDKEYANFSEIDKLRRNLTRANQLAFNSIIRELKNETDSSKIVYLMQKANALLTTKALKDLNAICSGSFSSMRKSYESEDESISLKVKGLGVVGKLFSGIGRK